MLYSLNVMSKKIGKILVLLNRPILGVEMFFSISFYCILNAVEVVTLLSVATE